MQLIVFQELCFLFPFFAFLSPGCFSLFHSIVLESFLTKIEFTEVKSHMEKFSYRHIQPFLSVDFSPNCHIQIYFLKN